MMTSNRRYEIIKQGEPGMSGDAWDTMQRLNYLGINISTSTLYRMKKNESKTWKMPNVTIPKLIKIVCLY